MISSEVYNVVMEKCLSELNYETATSQQQTAYRVLQFFNEAASGGFEGYIAWVIELLEEEERKPYVQAIVRDLRAIGALEMAHIVDENVWQILLAEDALAQDEISEDDYIEILGPANEQYYTHEDVFREQVEHYMEKLYEAIQDGSFYRNLEDEQKMNEQPSLAFNGIHNFRDMGGLAAANGRIVKYGLLLRSGHLAEATAEDIEKLEQLGVQLVFDFRDTEEVKQHPSPKVPGAEMVCVPAIREQSAMKVGSIEDVLKDGGLDSIAAHFVDLYKQLPFNNPSYKELMQHFVACKGPILQHCTAGKDRTGVGASLMYIMLGVSEQDIIAEYMLTNKANANKVPTWYTSLVSMIGEHPALKKLVGVSEDLLQAMFDEIKAKYGSYEAYFEAEYGITAADIEKVRAYYLQ